MMKALLLSAALTLIAPNATAQSTTIQPAKAKSKNTEESQPSVSPQSYVDEVLAIMQKYALHKADIDWVKVKTETTNKAKTAKTISDTYPAINFAFGHLKTQHTFLMDSNNKFATGEEFRKCYEEIADYNHIASDIGYIRIDGFSPKSKTDNTEFAQIIQNRIKAQDSKDLKGWIVDLRWNRGGNMWPMIAGIGPLLGNGTYGYLISDYQNSWGYQDGASQFNTKDSVKIEPYKLLQQKPKIAVLISQNTSSSGEATLISFKGRENVRIMGTNSCGLSTGNRSFRLSDGSRLLLTTTQMADRNKNIFGDIIKVDEQISHDKVIDVAINWLSQQ